MPDNAKHLAPITTTTPFVSVIIPAFNYGTFISYSLESMLNQVYENWECIVIDDGSTDNTAEIVNNYVKRDNRIHYVYQKNRGVSNARNKGLSHARGKYIQFLDADDLIENRKLQCHIQYLETNPEVDIIYGGARYFNSDHPDQRRYSNKDIDAPWMPEISGSGAEILEAIIKANIMVISAPLLRRRIIDQVGLFDKQFSGLEDWDYWIRCAVKGARFQFLDADGALSLIRWHSDSLSQNRLKILMQVGSLRHKIDKILDDKALIEYNRRTLVIHKRVVGIELVEAGYLYSGIKYLLGAASKSLNWGESLKWIYSAMVAPFAPRRNFHKIVYSPIKESLGILLGRKG